jgi:hypothetical protein
VGSGHRLACEHRRVCAARPGQHYPMAERRAGELVEHRATRGRSRQACALPSARRERSSANRKSPRIGDARRRTC